MHAVVDGCVKPAAEKQLPMENGTLDDGPRTPDRSASGELVAVEPAEEEPVLEPLQPVLFVPPVQARDVETSSAWFAWTAANLQFAEHGERQAQLQQLCHYVTAHHLQLQHVHIAPSTAPENLQVTVDGQVDDAAWWTASSSETFQAKVEGLRPGRFYVARVLAAPSVHVAGGSSITFPPVPSARTVLRTVPTPPGIMTPPTLAQRARNALKLKWGLPDEGGGEDILSYTLQMQPAPPGWEGMPDAQGFYEVYTGDERSWKVGKLPPGSRYMFRIKCRNRLGEGPWSLHSVFTTQASVPLQPAPPRVVSCTQDTSTLVWDAPHDCGAPISCYTLEKDDGRGGEFSVAYCGPQQQVVVNKLQAGLTYRYRLRAENSEGCSLWSVVGSGSTAAVKPGSPCGLSAVGINTTSATLRWQPPSSDGGSPVTAYQVQLQAKTKVAVQELGSDWLVIYDGPSTATTFSALQPGCQYMFRVAAVNSAGQGQFCVPMPLTTAADAPVAPEPPQGKPSSTSLVLEWGPPPHDGGSALTSYRVEMRCSPNHTPMQLEGLHPEQTLALMPTFLMIYSGMETCVQVTDLLPGTTYEFRMQAQNSLGASPWSVVGSAMTQPAAPMAPAAPTFVSSSSTSISLSWTPPYHQGSPVTSYTVNMLRCGAVSSSSNGPMAGKLLLGNSSNPSSVRGSSTGGSVKGAMSESGHSSCDDEPGPSGNGSLEEPHLRSEQRARVRWETVYTGSALNCEVRNLEPAHEYGFRVRAHNAQGGSSWGPASMAATAAAAPGPPIELCSSSVSSSQVQLAWQPPKHDHGAHVTGYMLEMQQLGRSANSTAVKAASRSQDGWVRQWQGSSCEHTVDGLTPGRHYCWRVRAGNSQGWGPWCEPATGTPAPDVPSAPLHLTCTGRTFQGLKLKWALPAEEHGAPVVQYLLQVQAPQGSWQDVSAGPDTSAKVDGLEPGTQYQVQVAAVNCVGRGPWSAPEAAATALRPPGPPLQLEAAAEQAAAGQLQLSVSWDAPVPAAQSADVVGYEVEAAPAGGSGQALKLNVARNCSCQLPSAAYGCTYSVRVRSVGAGGAGHSNWSKAVSVATPPPPEPPAAALNGHAGGDKVLALVEGGAAGKRKKAKQRADKEANGEHTPATAAPRGAAPATTFKTNGAARQRPKPRGLKSRAKAVWGVIGNYAMVLLLFVVMAAFGWMVYDDHRAKAASAAAAWPVQ